MYKYRKGRHGTVHNAYSLFLSSSSPPCAPSPSPPPSLYAHTYQNSLKDARNAEARTLELSASPCPRAAASRVSATAAKVTRQSAIALSWALVDLRRPCRTKCAKTGNRVRPSLAAHLNRFSSKWIVARSVFNCRGAGFASAATGQTQ